MTFQDIDSIEIDIQGIRQAHKAIQSRVHRTPLLTSNSLNDLVSATAAFECFERRPQFRLFFKCENFQRMGSFKTRGALNNLMNLIDDHGLDEVRRRGVVTHSSGNHAQALAMVASEHHIPAHIIMPAIAPSSKIAGARAYTEHVHFSGSTSIERTKKMSEIIAKTGAIYVPSSDHPNTILGQGTVALEMDHQYRVEFPTDAGEPASGLSVVLAPCGGGGLLAGTAAFYSNQPNIRVIGAEPSFQGANDTERGLQANPPTRITQVETLTIADGLRVPVGVHPWRVITSISSDNKRLLHGVYSVTEEQIKAAMKVIMERLKILVEPSSATPLAVILFNEDFRRWASYEQEKEGVRIWDIGVILSGGNTTVEDVAKYFGDRASHEH